MANVKLFEYTGDDLILNTPELELIPEFKNILDLDEKEGKGTAWKCFTYLFLAFDNLSPYGELTEEERIETAFSDSRLTMDQVRHGVMQAAASKYIYLQETRVIKMLKAAQETVEKLTQYFKDLDFNERTEAGGLVYKANDVMRQLKELADVHEGLEKLEFQVRQEKDVQKGNRGDNEEGFNN